jgi:dsDNA-binding SOS-regulon protein
VALNLYVQFSEGQGKQLKEENKEAEAYDKLP